MRCEHPKSDHDGTHCYHPVPAKLHSEGYAEKGLNELILCDCLGFSLKLKK
jgi:hypothetical protein